LNIHQLSLLPDCIRAVITCKNKRRQTDSIRWLQDNVKNITYHRYGKYISKREERQDIIFTKTLRVL